MRFTTSHRYYIFNEILFKLKKRKKAKTKKTGPALQSIIANLLGCLHHNARQELMDSFEGNETPSQGN